MVGRKRRPDRRALTNVGGAARARGDKAVAKVLTRAARPPKKADARGLTHGFHTWPARMHPWTARCLIEAAPEGGGVLDPFMGGGTVIVESLIAGRPTFGRDVNPVALEVAWARTRLWSPKRRRALVDRGRAAAQAAAGLRESTGVPEALRTAIGGWFDPPALAELWSLAEAVKREPDDGLRRMLAAAISSLVVKASRQESDSRPRRDPNHRWVPAKRVTGWFVARVEEHARGLEALSAAAGDRGTKPRLALADARGVEPGLAGKIAAVITSPPYPGVYDYAHHHRLRYALLDHEAHLARRAELGARRAFAGKGPAAAEEGFVEDLGRTLSAWAEALIPAGRAYVVIGDGQHREGTIPVLPLVEAAAQRAKLEVLASISQPRPVFGRARHAKRSRRDEHIVALGRRG